MWLTRTKRTRLKVSSTQKETTPTYRGQQRTQLLGTRVRDTGQWQTTLTSLLQESSSSSETLSKQTTTKPVAAVSHPTTPTGVGLDVQISRTISPPPWYLMLSSTSITTMITTTMTCQVMSATPYLLVTPQFTAESSSLSQAATLASPRMSLRATDGRETKPR